MINSLRRISAVFKREFSALTASAAAWVFIVIFLVLSGTLTFWLGNILDSGQADLTPFFNWMPWLFLFVVPALAMPLWSEERRTGMMDLTLSYPVTITELVFGKFLAAMALLALALLFTIGTPVTIDCLGDPDWNAVCCGYLGALLAGAVFLAVSCFCSALTKSQTASFLLSLLLCAILLLTGWEKISEYLAMHLPQGICRWISSFSLLPNYEAFQRGLIDASELAYLVLTTLLFLILTSAVLKFSASGSGSLFRTGTLCDKYTLACLGKLAAGILIPLYLYSCLIYASDVLPLRFDMTGDKAYSLTSQTEFEVATLPKKVQIRLFITPESSGMPREWKLYAERVQWLLKDMVKASNGKLSLETVWIEQDSDEEEAAQLDGLIPIQVNATGDRFYLGVAISSGAELEAIPQLTLDREMLLEYDMIRAIRNVTRGSKPLLGVMSAVPVCGTQPTAGKSSGTQPLDFIKELQKDYHVAEIPLNTPVIPEEAAMVLVYHPVGIPERALYALDQYLMNGGKLAVFLDPDLMWAAGSNLKASHDAVSADINPKKSNLGKLTEAWGVTYDPEKTSADMDFKYNPNPQYGLLEVRPDIMLVTEKGINREAGETSALTSLMLIHAGAFMADSPLESLRYTPLVSTSAYSKLLPAGMDHNQIAKVFYDDPQAQNGKPMPLVLRITGKFKSAFHDGAPDASALDNGRTHLPESTGMPAVVLFADCDMLLRDAYARTLRDSSGATRTQPWNDNLTLLMNVMESLASDETMAALRTRKPMSRPLTELTEKRQQAEKAFADRTKDLILNFELYQRELKKVQKKLASAQPLTQEDRQILNGYYIKSEEIKREVRDARNKLRLEIDSLNSSAKLVNIILIPAAVAILGIAWGIFRRTARWINRRKK